MALPLAGDTGDEQYTPVCLLTRSSYVNHAKMDTKEEELVCQQTIQSLDECGNDCGAVWLSVASLIAQTLYTVHVHNFDSQTF